MNANFTILLFLLAFANYANAEHHGDVGELIRELTQGDQHLATAKNNAKADPIRNIDLPQLTEINGKGALDKANKKNTKELDQFKKDVEHMGYSAVHVGMSKRKVLIEKWLASPDRVESLVKVFEYLVGLDSVPICVANQFLKSIDPNNLIIGKVGQKVPVVGSDGTDRTAFIFSQTGVRQLNIDEEGIECKESLKEPAFVAKLFLEIVVGLEKEEKEGISEGKIKKENEEKKKNVKNRHATLAQAMKEDEEWETKMEKLACTIKIKVVFNHLLEVFIADKHQVDAVVKIVRKKISKWDTIGNKLEKVGHQLKEYSVMLLTPANFQYFLTAVISLAKMSGAMTLAVSSIRAFGLDEMMTKEIESFTNTHVCDAGVICEVDLFLFGVNGVIPLYFRGYAVNEKKKSHYYDHKGKEYSLEEVAKWTHSKEDDEKLIKTIASELSHQKGRSFNNFMEATVDKLKSLGDKKKWEERANKFKKGWGEFENKLTVFKQQVKEINAKEVMTSVGNAVKDFTLFLITPRHIAFAFKLILSIFGLYTPVYISLEVLQLLGITDVLIEIMKVSAEATAAVNHFREGGKAEGAMNFVFNENGVVPMLLTMGAGQQTTKRRKRVAKELEMFSLIKNAIVQHNGDSFRELYKFFIDLIKEKPIGLMLVQTFQKEQAADRVAMFWSKARRAHLGPAKLAEFDLEFMKKHAIKHIYHLREMNTRVEEFDHRITSCIKVMKDVCQLKMERGDQDVIVNAKANADNANADGKAKEGGTKVEHAKHQNVAKKP